MTQKPKHNNKKQAYLNCLGMTGLILGILCIELFLAYIFGIFPIYNTSTTPKSNITQISTNVSNTTQSSTSTYSINRSNNTNAVSKHTTSTTVTNNISTIKSNSNEIYTKHQNTITQSSTIVRDNSNNTDTTTNQKKVTNKINNNSYKENISISTGVIHYQYPSLYEKPSSDSTILISHLECNTKVIILGYSNGYYHVDVDGQTGYIYHKFIKVN